MFKRYWWVFLAMAGVAYLVLSRVHPKNEVGAISNQEASVDRPEARRSQLPDEELDKEISRESSRHSSGEIEKHQAEERRLLHLKKAVMDQEQKVEERRKVLATIVRTKGVIYKGPDADYSGGAVAVENQGRISSSDPAEEAARRVLDAQDYVDAKRDFETDQRLLQEMKLKLISEKAAKEPSGR